MYALHDLLNRDARILNRHARKMYGFLPGLVTAVHDPKSKRHQKGYVKVCFPGLQDLYRSYGGTPRRLPRRAP